MNPIGWLLSSVKLLDNLHKWTIKNPLRSRGERLARAAPTPSVLRGSRVELHWYERFAARELEREGHGTIRDGYYETWVNVTPAAIMQAMTMRGELNPWHE